MQNPKVPVDFLGFIVVLPEDKIGEKIWWTFFFFGYALFQ
jgi:hypothetical protein